MVWQMFKLDNKRGPLEKGDFRENGARTWRSEWLEPGNNCRGIRLYSNFIANGVPKRE